MKFKDWVAVGVLSTTLLLAGCGPNRSGQTAPPSASSGQAALVNDSAGYELRTGDKVTLTKLGYGCRSQNILARAIEEQNLGNVSEVQATIGNFPDCITHDEFPVQQWTVTAVQSPLVQIGVAGSEDVAAFRKAASNFGKADAKAYKNRYWIPPQWLLKDHPPQP
ncbi:MAG TPA: hypothetical protein VFW83_02835 [Bryobacteraceae bacterium]|nr:hypothetical protein [Bryobacteraceae bacterium]